jgi:spore coat protein CotH
MLFLRVFRSLPTLTCLALAACGSSSSSTAGTGGAAASGGQGATGGSTNASGGAPASGGATTGGKAATTGGAVETGGSAPAGSNSGGAPSNGGAPASGGAPSNGGAPASGGSGAAGGASGGAAPVDASAELYDEENLPRFDLALSEASMAALDAEPEVYVEGALSYDRETVSRIGVRIKGEGSRRTLEQKAAFKLKFDEFVDRQAFRGLRRMTLNNMVEDPSFMAERLAYRVFREAGLPAPRCNNALLYVNGEYWGVYANVEAEDKTFLRRWFSDDGGNLYEEGQTDFVPGAEAKFDLETNETANDRTDLAGLIAAFQGAEPDTFLEDLGAALDTERFLRFTAAELLVNQWDMYAYTMFYPNNFRLYSDPTSGRFVFLPWGMDMSMKPFRDSRRKHLRPFELARQGDRMNTAISAGLIFQRCLQSEGCKARYAETVAELVDVYEKAELEARAERHYEQIREHVESDPRSEYGSEDFETGYASLLSTIRERAAAVRAEL